MDKSIFDLEVKEKRSQAFLNRSRTGSKGGSRSRKGMNTPYDYMSKKERSELNGEVKVYKMYETIIPYEEFKLKDEGLQKEMLTRWREIYSNEKIFKEMGMNNWKYYELIGNLNIPKKARRDSGKPRKAKAPKAQKVSKVSKELPKVSELTKLAELEKAILSETKIPQIAAEPITTHLLTKGLFLEYNGDYNSEELNKLFTKLQLLLDGEYNQFKISLSLTEIVD